MRNFESSTTKDKASAFLQIGSHRLVGWYPELWRNEMTVLGYEQDCVLQLFAGSPHVITLTTAQPHGRLLVLQLAQTARLYDRMTEADLTRCSSKLRVYLSSWQSVALELRVSGSLCPKPVRLDHVSKPNRWHRSEGQL